MDVRFDAAVGLTFMPDFDRAERSRIRALRPFEFAQLWNDADALHAGFERLNTEHMLTQPRRRPTRPTVTQAVPKPDVTMRAVIAVNIPFPGRDNFINARRVVRPRQIEIFPERRRAVIQHRSPIRADEIQSRVRVAGIRENRRLRLRFRQQQTRSYPNAEWVRQKYCNHREIVLSVFQIKKPHKCSL